MAVAGSKLRINGTIIDVGLVYTYVITGLTTGVPTTVEVAFYGDDGILSEWSEIVTKTPTCPSMLLDGDGNAILDGDGNAIIVYL